jgi:hypothetical protein
MKRFTKLIAGAALIAGAVTIATAAPASAQPYGYAPRAVVCDPYSRFYDPFVCRTRYYDSYSYGGPVISFGFGGGWRGGHDFHGGGGFHGGGHDNHGGSHGSHGGVHGNSGGHHR